MLQIHTVAAGGGSVITCDGQRLQVGPASAGADPGPACYRRGGPLTLTDANLLLGRLQPEAFPALFGPARDQPLDPDVVGLRFEALAQELAASPEVSLEASPRPPEQLAEGALAIAVERMAEAIRRISIQQGHDVRRAALCCFGGAGGQHACALAEALGIRQVLLHPLAGVLSAYGIGLAEERCLLERTVRRPLTPELLEELTQLRHELMESLAGAALREGERCDVQLQLRTPGSDSVIPLPWTPWTSCWRALPVATSGASATAPWTGMVSRCGLWWSASVWSGSERGSRFSAAPRPAPARSPAELFRRRRAATLPRGRYPARSGSMSPGPGARPRCSSGTSCAGRAFCWGRP